MTRAMLAVGLAHQRTGPQKGPQARKQRAAADDTDQVVTEAVTTDEVTS